MQVARAEQHIVASARGESGCGHVLGQPGPHGVGNPERLARCHGLTLGATVRGCDSLRPLRLGQQQPTSVMVANLHMLRADGQASRSTSAVSSPPASPVLTTLLGSNRSTAVSVSARGQC